MRTIDKRTFWATVVAGLVATFVMTMTGFWQGTLGPLQHMDVGAMLAGSMNLGHEDPRYGIVAGNVVHYLNGVILALIFVAFLQNVTPGGWLVQGIVYGILLWIAAGLIVVPLATGTQAGLFFLNTPMPGSMLLSSLTFHLAYGVALTLSLQAAGIAPEKARAEGGAGSGFA